MSRVQEFRIEVYADPVYPFRLYFGDASAPITRSGDLGTIEAEVRNRIRREAERTQRCGARVLEGLQ